jgi:formate hydrogenlyase subunit 3/multisubunit Na+/H+ antiporter MnhD subunit
VHSTILVIIIPVAAGLLAYAVHRLRNELCFIGAAATLYYAVRLFIQSRSGTIEYTFGQLGTIPMMLRLDSFSGFVLLFAAAFAVLVVGYSFPYMRGWNKTRGYFLYTLLALAGANGILLAANLVVLLVFWGGLLAVTYGLLLSGRDGSDEVAAKALTVVGLSDFALMVGVILLLARVGWIDVAPAQPLPLRDPTLVLAFLLVGAGALAKAGSMPFHSWIPSAAGTAPATVLAFVPASLDKLLGIYLLTRLTTRVFDIASNDSLRLVLMIVGAVTILGAVMMALVQRRVMRLLSFHAVSQVGYMVLGIGTGTAVGIAGGLFHMLNHSVYKAGLFLSAGSVEHRTQTDNLDELGGLAARMPVTFLSFLVAALAISGVPPLNGFVSKWMVYQGIVELAREGTVVYPVLLVAAMLGSVLTLASFLKLLHSVFLGRRPADLDGAREVGPAMWMPTAVLAGVCVVFGVFAYQLPLQNLIYPSLPFSVVLPGIWQPGLTTALLTIAAGLGATVYLLGTGRRPTSGRTFVGGEALTGSEESRVPGTAFYSSVKHLPLIDDLLRFGEAGAFDLYSWVVGCGRALGLVTRQLMHDAINRLTDGSGRLARSAGRGIAWLATGQLTAYVGWVLAGAIVLYLVLR